MSPYLCFHRNTFLFPDSFFELDVALISLLGRYLRCSFLFASRLSPVALFHRFFSEPPQKRVFRLSVAYPRTDYCPLSIPLVSRFTQRVITLYILWLDFSSDVRFAALSITPCTATTNEFYAEHSS